MILVETYRGYEIYEVEKKGRKMWKIDSVCKFSLSEAKACIDNLVTHIHSVYIGFGVHLDSVHQGLYSEWKSRSLNNPYLFESKLVIL